jgi:hypothetical protein
MHKQNVGAQIMYKSGGASPNCFCLEKSALAGFSQTSLMFSSRCCPLLMQSQSLRLPLAAPLLWADSLPHCTGSFVPAPHAEMSQILVSTNYRGCKDFTDFRQTLAVNISAHRRPIKNWQKQIVINITVQYQFFYP